jgi:hypothetical protein
MIRSRVKSLRDTRQQSKSLEQMFICSNVTFMLDSEKQLFLRGIFMRLSIDVTQEQHQSIKALAAMQGKSIKEYVMQRLLPLTADEEKAMRELEELLAPRIEAAERGEVVSTSVMAIFQETLAATQP